METAADIFEVLVTIAILLVLILAGVVLAVTVRIVRLVHIVLRRIEKSTANLSGDVKTLFESAAREKSGIASVAMILSGFLWRFVRKNSKGKKT